MSNKLAIELNVNGEPHDVLATAATPLLEALRTGLGLTGSKRGCNHGVCGACTVLLDGKLARSCLTLAVDVGERPVTTIEGIAARARSRRYNARCSMRAPSSAGSARPGLSWR